MVLLTEIETTGSGNQIQIGLPNDVTIGNNLTVDGNLTINGTTTAVNSTTVTVDDPIFVVGGDSNRKIQMTIKIEVLSLDGTMVHLQN